MPRLLSEAKSGIGARGEVEISYGNDENKRRIPLRIAMSMALILNGVTLAIYLIVLLFAGGLLNAHYHDLGFSWGKATVQVLKDLWRHLSLWLPAYLIILIIEWPGPYLYAFQKNLRPKLLNDNYPPPWGQIDPAMSGPISWDNWPKQPSPLPTPQPAPLKWEFEGTVSDSNGHRWYTTFETHHALAWHYFCKDLVRQRDAGKKPRFSYRGASRWKVPEAEFEELSKDWLLKGYSYQEPSPNGNGHISPLRRGWIWIEGMASVIPEQAVYP